MILDSQAFAAALHVRDGKNKPKNKPDSKKKNDSKKKKVINKVRFDDT